MEKRGFTEVDTKLKAAFAKVKQDFIEHLSAINENTSEIQALYDYLYSLDAKIEKISQRVESIQMSLGVFEEKKSITLNSQEKQIFLTLYTEESPISHQEVALRSGLSEPEVREFSMSLTQKGIPILKSFCLGETKLKIPQQFKEKQAKENIINLSLDSFFPQQKSLIND